MKKFLIFLSAIWTVLAAQSQIYPTNVCEPVVEWVPFIEQGKTLKYNEVYVKSYDDITTTNLIFKIEGETTINGKQYAIVNLYHGQNQYPDADTHFCYMREDNLSHTLYTIVDDRFLKWGCLSGYNLKSGEEFVVFSLTNPLLNDTFLWVVKYFGIYDDYNIQYCQYQYKDGPELKGYKGTFSGYPNFYLLERVGYISDTDNAMFLGCVWLYPTNGTGLFYEFYEVTDGEGNIIYCNEKYKPKDAVENVEADAAEATEYYDLQGRKADETPTEQQILIEKRGNKVQKVLNNSRILAK